MAGKQHLTIRSVVKLLGRRRRTAIKLGVWSKEGFLGLKHNTFFAASTPAWGAWWNLQGNFEGKSGETFIKATLVLRFQANFADNFLLQKIVCQHSCPNFTTKTWHTKLLRPTLRMVCRYSSPAASRVISGRQHAQPHVARLTPESYCKNSLMSC